MTGEIHTTTVNGIQFSFWSDFIFRGTFARNEQTGETHCIRYSGYIHKNLTTRKAIAAVFGLPTFKK